MSRFEVCWACNGSGTTDTPTGLRWCPWCRGRGELHDGAHEVGQTCDCHLGEEWTPGDDWFALTGFESDGYLIARLSGLPDEVRSRIEQELDR